MAATLRRRTKKRYFGLTRTFGADSTAQIKNAWNALLLNFRTESLSFLEKISLQYKLYLFSNTNSIHLVKFEEIFTRDTGKSSLDAYFTKAYYSNIIGYRKPE